MSPIVPPGQPTPDSVPNHASPEGIGAPSATSNAAPAESSGPSGSMDRRILLGLAGLAGVAALSRMAKAGDLSPPAGQIGPTGISLSQLDQKNSSNTAALSSKLARIDAKVAFTDQGVSEPRTPIRSLSSSPTAQFVITEPGAYCLTDNIEQLPGMVCIDVQCSDVDIDCQGFAFQGSGSAASPPSSCVRSSGQSNIELYDCTFSGWTGCCIDCDDCDDVSVSDCIFRHCTCPPGVDSTGGTVPGAMIRCRDNADISNVDISSCDGCAIKTRNTNMVDLCRCSSSTGPVLLCGDGCSISDFTVTNCGGVPSGSLMACGRSCTVIELVVVIATCALVLQTGDNCSIGDVLLDSVQGGGIGGGLACDYRGIQARQGQFSLQCGDGSCIDDCLVHTCTLPPGAGAMMSCGQKSSVSDSQFVDCSGLALSAGSSCVIDCVDVSGGAGGAFVCGTDCCLDGCTVVGHTAVVIIVGGDRSRVNELEARLCVGLCVSVGVDSTLECCEVTGGAGGAFLCDDGSCVDDCKVSNHQGVAIQCASRCSVESCKVVASWGVSCGAECCVHDNEISYDGSGGAGGGGAINVMGERCSITSNYVSGRIYLFGGSDRSLLDDNHLVSSGGPPGTGGASISIAQGVTGCSLRSNHVSRGSTTQAFVIPQGNSYGPIVNLISGGDMSTLPPDSNASHPHANFLS